MYLYGSEGELPGSPPSGSKRVHELAKDLGYSALDVLRAAQDAGLHLRSAASIVSDSEAERIRATLAAPRPTVSDRRPRRVGNSRPIAGRGGTTVSELFKGDPDAVLIARKLGVSFVPDQRHETQELTGTARLLRNRYPQLSAADARRHAVGWTGNMMDEEIVAAWLDAGLGPTDHATVGALVEHGVRPQHLDVVIDGQRVGSMLRGGASATRVVGILRAHGHL